MRYYVTLDFKRGPSFSVEVEADDEQKAKLLAHGDARFNYGFLHPVKKATVREVSQDESAS